MNGNRKPGRAAAAFTLFEVLISISIFLLLVVGVFAAVRASLIASAEVAGSQLDAERLDAFEEFLRKVFLSLPPDAKVELKFRQQAGLGDVVEILLWPVPSFLQFGKDSADGAAISAQPDGRGGFNMKLGFFNAEDSSAERDQRLERDATWLMLLPDVKQIRWRFAPARNPVYADAWKEQAGRPGLAELTLETNTGDASVYQFWIPPLQRRSSSSPPEVVESPHAGQPPVPGAAVPPENDSQ